MSITVSSILNGQDQVSRQAVIDHFKEQKVLFEDKKWDRLRNMEALCGSAAISILIVGSFFAFVLSNFRPECRPTTRQFIAIGSSVGGLITALFTASLVARSKKKKYLQEPMNREAVHSFLQTTREAANNALSLIESSPQLYPHELHQKMTKVIETVEATDEDQNL